MSARQGALRRLAQVPRHVGAASGPTAAGCSTSGRAAMMSTIAGGGLPAGGSPGGGSGGSGMGWRDAWHASSRWARNALSSGAALASGAVQLAHLPVMATSAMVHQARSGLEAWGQTPTGKAAALQLAHIWEAHSGKISVLAVLCASWLLYHASLAVGSLVTDLSTAAHQAALMAASLALVALAVLRLRSRTQVNPARVYQLTMLQLNSNAGVLEVLGAPLTGSDPRLALTFGGGTAWRGLLPHARPQHITMVFPLSGRERQGLVSVEASKAGGKYRFRLLAVDLPPAGRQPAGRLLLRQDAGGSSVGGAAVLQTLHEPFAELAAHWRPEAAAQPAAGVRPSGADDVAEDEDQWSWLQRWRQGKLLEGLRPLAGEGGRPFRYSPAMATKPKGGEPQGTAAEHSAAGGIHQGQAGDKAGA